MAAGPVEVEAETASCLEVRAAIAQCALVVVNEMFLCILLH